jgi:integrase
LYSLGTTDKAQARRILTRLVASSQDGEGLPSPIEANASTLRVSDYCETWLARRKALGVGMVNKERRCLELYALGTIGRINLREVRASHIRSIVDEALARGLKRATVAHIHGALQRMFRAALADELIEQNPVAAVRVPKVRAVRKERAILTDAEFARFIACAEVDLELRMLSLVARCEGGMRTGDLHRWDWSQIDCATFSECIIPRAKTGTPQTLSIPRALAPFLRDWWERAGRPDSGPVFPARIGKRAGQEKRPLTSYAKRLRRDLVRADVWRLPPVEVPATKGGIRTDLGRSAPGSKFAPNPRDPLYFETATTLPVDFHSFRRAFASALAEAGVNVQHAMHLTAHSDPRVHARYVMRTSAMRAIPEAAIPRLGPGPLVARHGQDVSRSIEGSDAVRIVITSNDSLKSDGEAEGANALSLRHSLITIAPAAGLEPATRRLTAERAAARAPTH